MRARTWLSAAALGFTCPAAAETTPTQCRANAGLQVSSKSVFSAPRRAVRLKQDVTADDCTSNRIWATRRRRRWRRASTASAIGSSNTTTWTGTAPRWTRPASRRTGRTIRCGDVPRHGHMSLHGWILCGCLDSQARRRPAVVIGAAVDATRGAADWAYDPLR